MAQVGADPCAFGEQPHGWQDQPFLPQVGPESHRAAAAPADVGVVRAIREVVGRLRIVVDEDRLNEREVGQMRSSAAGSLSTATSPRASAIASRTARTDSAIEPRWTGM